ncbi:MAG TPA: crosslink repair DNA glycosylase YcaQ family protein [Anaerolinea sp.]|nr:crosslink repair DNA glycosylase YcaQ family protein [Anaerolinea sp.]
MPHVSTDALNLYRAQTFRLNPGQHLASQEDAVAYVNERGFVFFWPYKGIEFPSLWSAVAGNRPVADAHDDPGHVTWGWKDGLLGQKRVYYARVIKKRNTFLSLDLLPYFYALSPNYGSPEEDYLIDYEAGQLTAEARAVYEALLDNGPLDTVALRKAAHLTSRGSDNLFNRALETLQTTFRILPTGVAEAGAWNYAFIYDLVTRHYPDVIEQSHPISEWEARRHLALTAMNTLGASRTADLQRLFGWGPTLLEKALQKLVDAGHLVDEVQIEGKAGAIVALSALCGEK